MPKQKLLDNSNEKGGTKYEEDEIEEVPNPKSQII